MRPAVTRVLGRGHRRRGGERGRRMPHRAPHRPSRRRDGAAAAPGRSRPHSPVWPPPRPGGEAALGPGGAGRSRATAAACPSPAVGYPRLVPHFSVRSRLPELLLPFPGPSLGPSWAFPDPPGQRLPAPSAGPAQAAARPLPAQERRRRLRLQTAAAVPRCSAGRNPHSLILLGYPGQCEAGVELGFPRRTRPDLSPLFPLPPLSQSVG